MNQPRRRRRLDRPPSFLAAARALLGIEAFRPGQQEALEALFDGHDVLAVLPTGSGKSAIYQIAASLIPGPTVVVSPLIALQRDQVERLQDPRSGGAAVVNSLTAAARRSLAFSGLEGQRLEFVFLAPEQLHREDVLDHLRKARPSLFVVDEAHCISEWGHDFRPDYLRLGGIIEALGHPPVLALTATASLPVREEIMERLRMRHPQVVAGAMDRPNIWLGVQSASSARAKRRMLLTGVEGAAKPGIVYAASRRQSEEIAADLADRGVSVECYHGGMNRAQREAAQAAFMGSDENGTTRGGTVDVMVATSAFGMGIDKPDVRFVFHNDVTASLDAYYQELGRAGRDGTPARAVLFYRPEDFALHKFFAAGGHLRREELEAIADAVAEAGDLDEEALQARTGISRTRIVRATAGLEDEGLVDQPAPGMLRSAGPDMDAAAAAGAVLEHEKRHHRYLLARLERVRVYAEMRDCRRQYLLEYFGEEAEPCGNCDNCDRGLPTSAGTSTEQPFPVKSRVVHSTLGKGVVMDYRGNHMTVAFDESGEKVIDVRFVVDRGMLRRENPR